MGLDQETRTHVDRCQRKLPQSVGGDDIVFGYDGVVDHTRIIVSERTNPEQFKRMGRMGEFAARVSESADLDASCSVEWLSEGTRPGGHVSHLGRAFERLGYAPTLIGRLGTPPAEPFRREYDRSKLVSIGPPSTTDAIEFDDGKVMLNDPGECVSIDWQYLVETVGFDTLAGHVDGAAAMGLGYWATIPRFPSIWTGLAEELWPVLSDPPRRMFVDPGDVRRLSANVRRDGVESLATLDAIVPVTFSANRAESVELYRQFADGNPSESLAGVIAAVRESLGVDSVVAHSVSEAVVATDRGVDTVAVPRCSDPELTTSAGDHFNAGLLLAYLLDIRGGAALVVACALAGWFVRTGDPPSYAELVRFVDEYESLFDKSDAS